MDWVNFWSESAEVKDFNLGIQFIEWGSVTQPVHSYDVLNDCCWGQAHLTVEPDGVCIK